MKSRRTRILVIVIAAAIALSFVVHWEDMASGFRDGWNDARRERTMPKP